MEKPLFNADDAEEYFSSLCASYRLTANEIFNRDNEGRHASEQMYSAEYQKYVGMQIAMREVLEYFSKFDLVPPQKTNADRIRAMTGEELAKWINFGTVCDKCAFLGKCVNPYSPERCVEGVLTWLHQPAEEVQ